MPLDPYSPCICGSGKKLKFCCGSEIPTELSKVYDLVTGDQRVAALDQIDQLLEKPSNAKIGALHHLKTLSLLELGDTEKARTAAANFREALPDSSVAYAFSAMVELSQGLTEVGEDYLQTALELADGRITNQL